MPGPAVSVIVPTRDRADSAVRLVQALARQDTSDPFEVIVVADGCTDGTVVRVAAMRSTADVHVLDMAPAGPALARNCGAALARGDILLFLDDDVEPDAGVIGAHLALHRAERRAIGLGYLPLVARGTGFFPTILRGWWESMFDGARRPAHRFSYRNLLSGHVSIPRAEFESLGGFRSELSCHEDWEFGYRALKAGLRMLFVPAATAWHHDNTDLAKALQRKFDEGVADVRLAELHPELASSLPLGWTARGTIDHSRVIALAWRDGQFGDRLFRALLRVLPIYERWRLRYRWRALLERALTYQYWRGVAHAAGTRAALAALLHSTPPRLDSELVVDLAEGLASACARVDAQRPRSLRVVLGSRLIGDIPDEPGSEPLRAPHLREALAGTLSSSVAVALAKEQRLPGIIAATLREHLAASEGGVAGSAQACAA